MSVDKTGFVLNTKVGFKLVERKEGRWKGKRGKSGKGREKERRKEVSWFVDVFAMWGGPGQYLGRIPGFQGGTVTLLEGGLISTAFKSDGKSHPFLTQT